MRFKCLLPTLQRLPKIAGVQCHAMGKQKHNYYAVAHGRNIGVFYSWSECSAQVIGYSRAVFKGFASLDEAERFLKQRTETSVSDSCKPTKKRKLDSTPPSNLKLFFDGGSRGNPGIAGFGIVLYDSNDTEVASDARHLEGIATNNKAEYAGLLEGILAALKLGCKDLTIRGDSTLVIKQATGEWQVKNEGLMPYATAAKTLLGNLDTFDAKAIPREENKRADALSNIGMDSYKCSDSNARAWSISDFTERMQQYIDKGNNH